MKRAHIAAAAALGAVALAAQTFAGMDRTGWRHFDMRALMRLDFSMFRMKEGDAGPIAFTAADRDLVIRTVYGEAVFEPRLGQMAVAWVIRNRLTDNPYGWTTLSKVVTACGFTKRDKRRIKICQFEPWLDREKEIMALAADSDHYQRIGSVVDDVLEGRTEDPTAGAWYFLNVATVKKRREKEGRDMPLWAQNCTDIGLHSFCKPTPEQLAGVDAGMLSGLWNRVRGWF